MKGKYKGCEIEVTKEKSITGEKMLFYNVFDGGYEVTSGFSEGEDTIKDYFESLKNVIDDYKEHPEDYEQPIKEGFDSILERNGNIKKFKYEFKVDDDFEAGCCYDCPLYDFTEELCQMGYRYEECPLEEVEEIN